MDVPRPSSSSTSTSCSAAMEKSAVTLYRFVFRFVSRRELIGDVALYSVNADIFPLVYSRQIKCVYKGESSAVGG